MSAGKKAAMSRLKKKKAVSAEDRTKLLDGDWLIEVDSPDQYISRITLNNPQWENRMNNRMRAQLYEQLQLNDQNPDVRVTIIRGAGESFCAGYEQVLSAKDALPMPMFTDNSDGEFQRNTLQGWFMIMDLAKPVIAQVHGNCLSAGSELASACDLVYTSPDAKIGYPEVRNYGLPDTQMYPWLTGMRNALSIMLLAETMDGTTAVQRGWATGVYPKESLEESVIEKARRVAKIPSDLLSFNKRSVHRAFEAQGMRTNLRYGTDLEALMWHSGSAQMLRRAETLYLRGAKKPATTTPSSNKPRTSATPRSPAAAARKVATPTAPPRAAPRRPNITAKPVTAQEPAVVAPKIPEVPQVNRSPPKLPRASRSPADMAKANALRPTPVSNSTKLQGSTATDGVVVHINKPIAIHIHSDEPRSKL